jgi:hypothetical protein
MKVLACTLLCFLSVESFSRQSQFLNQKDSLRNFIFTAKASLILNRGYSHHMHPIDDHALSGYHSRSLALKNNNLLPGFEIGGSVHANTKKYCHFFLESSYSLTQGHYRHDWGTGAEGSKGPVFSSTERDVICKINAQMWSFGAGLKWMIEKRIMLAMQMNFNYAFAVVVQEVGTETTDEWTMYPIHPSAPPNSFNSAKNKIDKKYTESNRALSFRISSGYELRKYHSGLLVFRNFGLGWQLPWWGLGFYKNF